MDEPCKMCQERGKTWNGGDPECGFLESKFSPANWNCATVNAIRDICDARPKGVDYQYCEDENYATVKIDDLLNDREGRWMGYALWVQWYKSRGRTQQMFLLGDDEPRRPTEEECLAIIAYYERNHD